MTIEELRIQKVKRRCACKVASLVALTGMTAGAVHIEALKMVAEKAQFLDGSSEWHALAQRYVILEYMLSVAEIQAGRSAPTT